MAQLSQMENKARRIFKMYVWCKAGVFLNMGVNRKLFCFDTSL